MPTASKLVAAISFAILAWFVTELVFPLLPEGTQTKWLRESNALVGLICGWKIMGPRGRDGLQAGLGVGLTTSAAMTIAAIFAHASFEMLKLSFRKVYGGPVEAVAAVFEICFENFQLIAEPTIIGTLVLGGFFCGWLTHRTGQRWS
ncbi:MAG: TrgA family protein [Pseudoruegeria sp.]